MRYINRHTYIHTYILTYLLTYLQVTLTNEAMQTHQSLTMPPAKSQAVHVLSDMTPGISGVHSTATLAESAPSQFDTDRMEAALAMTEMSQGTQCKSAGRSTAFSAKTVGNEQRKLHYPCHRDLTSRRQRPNRRLVKEQNICPPEVAQRSSDLAGGTEVDVVGSRMLSYEYDDHHATPTDSRKVDGAMLAKMTREILERQPSSGHGPIGKFYRTSISQQDSTCGVAIQTLNRPLNFEPSLASGRPKVTVAVSERQAERRASEEGKRPFPRLPENRRSSSDDVEQRHTARSSLCRRTSDPSEQRRSPAPRVPPIQSPEPSTVPMSNGRLRFPEGPSSSSSFYLQREGLAKGSTVVSPVPTSDGGALYWGLYGIQLSAPRVVALQKSVIPVASLLTPAGQQVRQSFVEPDVAVAAVTVPLQANKWSSDFIKNYSTPPNIICPTSSVSETPPTIDNNVLKAFEESVKVRDQIRTETDMNVEPLDLSRSSPNLAAVSAMDQGLVKSPTFNQILSQKYGRSSSLGSLSALKAFYEDPSMKSGSKKIGSGSPNSPVANTGIEPVEGTPSAICESPAVQRPADNALAAKMPAIHSNRNADVEAARRSEFRPWSSQNASSNSSSSISLLSRTVGDPLERTSNDACATRPAERWNQVNRTTGASLSFIDDDNDSAGFQLSQSTGDAGVIGSEEETVSSPAEIIEKRFSPLVVEARASPVMDTIDLRESPRIVKISVQDRSRVEENGEQKDHTCSVEQGATKINGAFDSRTIFHDNISTPATRSGSTLNGSCCARDSLDLSWRLPPKKRRMLERPVSPPVEQSSTQLPDSAAVEDRSNRSNDEKTPACIETQRANAAASEYIDYRCRIITPSRGGAISVAFVRPSACLSVCLSVRLSVRPSVAYIHNE